MQCNIVFWVLLSVFTCRDDSVTGPLRIVLHLPLFMPLFLFRFSLPYRLSTESLYPLCGWPTKTECPVLSAIVSLHRNTNGQKLKAINPLEVDPLGAWHQPPWLLSPNTSQSIAAAASIPPAQKPWPSFWGDSGRIDCWREAPVPQQNGYLNGVVEKRDYLFWTQEYNFWKIATRQLKPWSF